MLTGEKKTKTKAWAAVMAMAVICLTMPSPAMGAACLTDKCHGQMLNRKFVHGPVAVEDCQYCHVKTAEHKFHLAASGEEICYSCHDRGYKKGVNCMACHDPHGTDREFHLKPGVGGKCKK